jgi:hypothetical protein
MNVRLDVWKLRVPRYFPSQNSRVKSPPVGNREAPSGLNITY